MTLRNIKSVQKTLGLLLTVFSSTMLTPIVVALIYQETTSLIFVASFLITGLFGMALWLPAKKAKTAANAADEKSAEDLRESSRMDVGDDD